ncbi:putative lower head-tail connector protein [Serratia phage vB_SmaS_PhooPhighters]|uniref:Putative coat protein n=1 Tax=Serratia phage vB_SmaS_Rovert TaxID=2777363 RepID=A0A7T3N9T2_9CAUD|nr:putative coat protein [Serratia phage vB_SmaS_Rovert]QPX74975.1 putative coat protein [Serratia phage vB_SmaS_Rovert]UGO51948.1 putative lower head-tail connector protein [Serratia phage vB_SmaS_PhooPhighters]
MNTGKLKDRIKLLKKTPAKDSKGVTNKYDFIVIDSFRGNYRGLPGKEILMELAQINLRGGTLLTRYYKNANEDYMIKVNDGEIYEIVTFEHNDNKTSTLWTLRRARV